VDDLTTQSTYYARSADAGRSWTTRFRLAAGIQRPAVVAVGSTIYAAWWAVNDPAPGLSFRSNPRNGSGAWSPVRRLTVTGVHVSGMDMAASGSDVYVAYTHSATGVVLLAVSHDRGTTWRTVVIGITSLKIYGQYSSDAVVAASAAGVAVAWRADLHEVSTRTSPDHGANWGAPTVVGSVGRSDLEFCPGSCLRPLSIAMLGPRTAVAWAVGGTIAVRLGVGATWGPERRLAPAMWASSPDVALSSSSRLAVAYVDGVPVESSTDIMWRESIDNGRTWASPQKVSRIVEENSDPSILWLSESIRYVDFTWALEGDLQSYLATGIGTP
jgi:hypothetical protein